MATKTSTKSKSSKGSPAFVATNAAQAKAIADVQREFKPTTSAQSKAVSGAVGSKVRPVETPTPQNPLDVTEQTAGVVTPPSPTAPLTAPSLPSAPSPTSQNLYTVQPGDTVGGIASKTGVPMADIKGYRSGNANVIYPGEQLDLGGTYKAALQSIKNQNIPAPDTRGQASPAINQSVDSVKPPKEPQSVVGGIMEIDNNFDSILTNYDDFFSPPKQRQSLLTEYKKLSSSLGIKEMNEELIDAKRIIDGTEDDIRAEVTAAGGFATDSQVAALANARNKSLVKNYNYLLESRDAAMTQLNTMMNLSIQDRQMAEAEFDRKLNFAFKVQEFKERATTNARSGIQKFIDSVNAMGGNGYATLLNSLQSPYEVGVAEKVLGLASGTLAQAATLPGKVDTQVVKLDNGQTLLIDSKTGNTIKSLGGLNLSGASGGKSVTSATALNLADSSAALSMLNDLEIAVKQNTSLFGPFKGRYNSINPYNTTAQDLQSLVNSTKQIVGKYLEGGVLRAEDEKKYKKILPKLSDTPSVAIEKLNNVRTLVESVIASQSSTLKSAGYNPANISDENVVTIPGGGKTVDLSEFENTK